MEETPPIVLAALDNSFEEVDRLLDEDPSVIETTGTRADSPTALIVAARYGHLSMVKHLLGRGADLDGVTRWGKDALMCASEEGHRKVVSALLEHGANPSWTCDVSGRNALMLAARRGRADTVRMLLRRNGQDLNARDRDAGEGGKTALFLACKWGFRDTAQVLLTAGADPLIETDSYSIAQDMAGNRACTSLLQRYEKKWRHIRERTLLLGKLRGFLDYEAASALRPSFPAPAWLKGRLRDNQVMPKVELLPHREGMCWDESSDDEDSEEEVEEEEEEEEEEWPGEWQVGEENADAQNAEAENGNEEEKEDEEDEEDVVLFDVSRGSGSREEREVVSAVLFLVVRGMKPEHFREVEELLYPFHDIGNALGRRRRLREWWQR